MKSLFRSCAGFVGIVTLSVIVVLASGCTKNETHDGKVGACTTFAGGELSASWSDCPDHVRREVKCAMFVDNLKCDCMEDGVQKWFFNADKPPLSNRADATRVANTNCHWGLETR